MNVQIYISNRFCMAIWNVYSISFVHANKAIHKMKFIQKVFQKLHKLHLWMVKIKTLTGKQYCSQGFTHK